MTIDQAPELDWRARNRVQVHALGGVPVPSPTWATQVTVRPEQHGLIRFITPSGSALHLSLSWRAARSAAEAKTRIRWTQTHPSPTQRVRSVSDIDCPALFDYFEESIACAMGAFAAIEAFCNSTIVSKLEGRMPLKRRRAIVTLTAEEIEREASTDEKLERILPKLLDVPTPAGKVLWERFLAIKEIRDAVTHFKRKDEAGHAGAELVPTVLHAMLSTDPWSMPRGAAALIRYFCKDEPPKWLEGPPWLPPEYAAPEPQRKR